MNARKQQIIHLFVALVVGAIVAYVPLSIVANGFWFLDFSVEQRNTQSLLSFTEKMIEADKKEKGIYPQKLDASFAELSIDKDGWGRKWIYRLPDGKPLLESLGRDGKRGGFEQDADLSNRNPRSEIARLPHWKRLIHPKAIVATIIALMGGLFAGIATFVELNKAPADRKSLGKIILALFATCFLAACGAVFIAVAHMPSGH